jgi:hypothetical protein
MKIFAKNLEKEAEEQFKNCLSDDSCIDWVLMPEWHFSLHFNYFYIHYY